jgi:hypothetical protein
MRFLLIALGLLCLLAMGMLWYRHEHPSVQIFYREYFKQPTGPSSKEFSGTIKMRGWHNTGTYIDAFTAVKVRTFSGEYPRPFLVKVGDFTTESQFREVNGEQGFETHFMVVTQVPTTNPFGFTFAVVDRPAPLLIRADEATIGSPVRLVVNTKTGYVSDLVSVQLKL